MKALNRYKYHLLALGALTLLVMVGGKSGTTPLSHTAKDLPKIRTRAQYHHASEVFSTHSAYIRALKKQKDIRPFILQEVRRALPKKDKRRAFEIARAVITESNVQHLDPLFLLAVIHTESQFNLRARGSHGEIGLMQVLPQTARWLAPYVGLPHGKRVDLTNPTLNIRIGAAYFARLRRGFKGKVFNYVAAYNMGSRNVRRLLASNTKPRIYPTRVLSHYVSIYRTLEGHSREQQLASR